MEVRPGMSCWTVATRILPSLLAVMMRIVQVRSSRPELASLVTQAVIGEIQAYSIVPSGCGSRRSASGRRVSKNSPA